jgi:uncharacterized protein DUF4190/uncharacterized protein DUF4339
MALFKIRGSDQNEYGPVPVEVVLQWIAANRVSRQTLAQAEGTSEWRPLSEFPEFQSAFAAQSSRPPPVAGTAPPGSVPVERRQGMAIASLILGICGITCFSLIAGIPAVILGHIAYNRSRKVPSLYGGSGMAIAGLVLGYLSLLTLPILAGLFLPALAKAKERAQRITCVIQMKAVSQAINVTSQETVPANLLVLSNRLSAPMLLVCPSDPARRRPESWADVAASGSSYEYTIPKAGSPQQTADTVVLRCPIHDNVALADGSVSQGTRRPRSRP